MFVCPKAPALVLAWPKPVLVLVWPKPVDWAVGCCPKAAGAAPKPGLAVAPKVLVAVLVWP